MWTAIAAVGGVIVGAIGAVLGIVHWLDRQGGIFNP